MFIHSISYHGCRSLCIGGNHLMVWGGLNEMIGFRNFNSGKRDRTNLVRVLYDNLFYIMTFLDPSIKEYCRVCIFSDTCIRRIHLSSSDHGALLWWFWTYPLMWAGARNFAEITCSSTKMGLKAFAINYDVSSGSRHDVHPGRSYCCSVRFDVVSYWFDAVICIKINEINFEIWYNFTCKLERKS